MMLFEQDANGVVAMEAEHGALVAGDAFYWAEITEAAAANGVILKPTGQTWDKTLAGRVDYTFKTNSAGTFNLFFRLNTRGREGKIWVELDGQLFAVGPNGKNGRLYFHSSGYSWQNGYANALVNLSAGTHTLRIRSLISSVWLDRVAVVPLGSSAITVGSTAIGPAETGTGAPPVYEKPYTFADWLADESRNAHRVLLIELEHSTGTIYLGSRAYLSEHNHAYDDWLISAPSMENSLTSLADGIGDIEAYLPPDVPDKWINNDWRGYRCRWYYGDVSWRKSDFRLIAAATIEGVKTIGSRRYRFELAGDIQNLNRTYYEGSTTQTLQVQNAINWICEQGGIDPPVFLNLDNGELDIWSIFDVTDSSTMYADIKRIARSVGAFQRVNQLGELEIIKPDTGGEPTATLTNDDVQAGSISEVDVIPAYKRITVEYGNADARVTMETLAQTGDMDEELVISSALQSQSDATALAEKEAVTHAKSQRLWSIGVYHLTAILREGDYVAIDHEELQGAGVIMNIKPALDSTLGAIEVLI